MGPDGTDGGSGASSVPVKTLVFRKRDYGRPMSLRRRGVYAREEGLRAKLAKVRKVLFEKTGTLALETMASLEPEELASQRAFSWRLRKMICIPPIAACARY